MSDKKLKNYMLSFSFSGIKNIEKKIRFDFYKKTIGKDFDPSNYRVKAIYGENGSGKTAIITAMRLLKELIINPGYLNETKTQEFLGHIVNKSTNRVELETELWICINEEDNDNAILRYAIVLERGESDIFEITEESLARKNGNTSGNKYKLIYRIVKGEVQKLLCGKATKRKILKVSANRLNESTFLFYGMATLHLLKNVLKRQDFENDSLDGKFSTELAKDLEFTAYSLSVLATFFKVAIYMDEEDTHNLYFVRKTLDSIRKQKDDNLIKNLFGESLTEFITVGSQKVPKSLFGNYESKIKKMESFIRLFKSDLVSITIDKREAGEDYNCRLVMNYPGYSVDSEFESTGIRKLMRLYDCMVTANNGGIVFIDELDSNINDVYLCKMIEYFMYYGHGQLCFTTHNLDPMDLLKEYKNSIDFLSTINTVSSWNIHGNASPINAYKNGMIEDIPFNIDAIDFVGMFEKE